MIHQLIIPNIILKYNIIFTRICFCTPNAGEEIPHWILLREQSPGSLLLSLKVSTVGKKRHTLFLLYVNLIQTEMQHLLEHHDTAQNEICTTPS